jgi:hypothetical protein
MRSKPAAKSPKQKPLSAGQKRLIKLKSVLVESAAENQCRISVQLVCNRKTINCERTGPAEPDYQIMLAALCTLDALQKATDDQIKMELLFIERQQLEKINREIIMVLVDVNVEEGTRAATGACQVSGEYTETAARAVLDATNRIMELYFGDHS